MTHLHDSLSQLTFMTQVHDSLLRLQFVTPVHDPHLRLTGSRLTHRVPPPVTDGLCQHPSVISLAFQP